MRRLGLLLLLVASAARANEDPVHGLVLGFTSAGFSSARTTPTSWYLLELAYARNVSVGAHADLLRFSGGVRGGLPMQVTLRNDGSLPPWDVVPFEGFVRGQVAAAFGPWLPGVGLELGLSGLGRAINIAAPNRTELGGYAAVALVPLRFAFGRWHLSALDVQLGTGFPGAGSVMRFGFTFAQVGVSL